MIVGYGMIAYSMVVMACWTLDTNVDIGVGLLQKVTFGHWIAIKYEDELADINKEGKKFMTFKKLLISVLVFITIGILLTFVDIIGIITFILRAFGGLSMQF